MGFASLLEDIVERGARDVRRIEAEITRSIERDSALSVAERDKLKRLLGEAQGVLSQLFDLLTDPSLERRVQLIRDQEETAKINRRLKTIRRTNDELNRSLESLRARYDKHLLLCQRRLAAENEASGALGAKCQDLEREVAKQGKLLQKAYLRIDALERDNQECMEKLKHSSEALWEREKADVRPLSAGRRGRPTMR